MLGGAGLGQNSRAGGRTPPRPWRGGGWGCATGQGAARGADRRVPPSCTPRRVAHRVWVEAASGLALASANPLNPQMEHFVHVLFSIHHHHQVLKGVFAHDKVCLQRNLVSGKNTPRWEQGRRPSCHCRPPPRRVLRAVQAQSKSATEDLITGNHDRHHEEGSDQQTRGILL